MTVPSPVTHPNVIEPLTRRFTQGGEASRQGISGRLVEGDLVAHGLQLADRAGARTSGNEGAANPHPDPRSQERSWLGQAADARGSSVVLACRTSRAPRRLGLLLAGCRTGRRHAGDCAAATRANASRRSAVARARSSACREGTSQASGRVQVSVLRTARRAGLPARRTLRPRPRPCRVVSHLATADRREGSGGYRAQPCRLEPRNEGEQRYPIERPVIAGKARR